MLPDRWTAKVVGVTFVDGYPENLTALKDLADLRWLQSPGSFDHQDREPEPLPAVLIRNPDNAHDANAVEVHVPGVGMLGHLPRDLAGRVAPELDDGKRWGSEVEAVWLHPEHVDRPGLTVSCWRVDDPLPDPRDLLGQ